MRSVDGHFGLQVIGDHIAAFAAGFVEQRRRTAVFHTSDQCAVHGQQGNERFKCGDHVLVSRVDIGVVVFQVGDHFDARLEAEEHAVVLVCFDDEGFALAGSCVDVIVAQHSACNERWIASQFCKQECDHGGCRGFSVRPGHGDSGFIFHELSEKICPLVDGNVRLFGSQHFNVAIGYGG